MLDHLPQYILVVDDDPAIAVLLQCMLEAEGYLVGVAHDGLEALDQIAERPPDLILLDLDMPNLSGHEVCRRVKANPATRFVPITIVTAQSALETKLLAWKLGADEFLTKPFHNVEVVARCRSLLRLKRLVDELDSAEAIVFALARTVEAKSSYTQGHSQRVAEYALALARELGLSQPECELAHKGALIHDIGKIAVPDAILNKVKGLTPDEFALIKQHTIQGARIIEPLRSLRDTVPLILWHHERLDGNGYPDGLLGDDIPLLVRMLSVADVYDSLATARPYRAAIPRECCIQVLLSNAAGGGLDGEVVEAFQGLLDRGFTAESRLPTVQNSGLSSPEQVQLASW